MTFYTPGGGGWGDPFTRDPALVLDDVLQGLVSPEAARAVYGVAVGEGIDPEATARLRSQHRPPAPEFSFGSYRAKFEAEIPEAVQRAVNRAVTGRPPATQRFFRQQLIAGLRQRGEVEVSDVDELFRQLLENLIRKPGAR